VTTYQRVIGADWSALYADGALVIYGDHYIVDDRIADILGIDDITDVQLSDWYFEKTEGTRKIGAVQPTVSLILRKRAQRLAHETTASDLRIRDDRGRTIDVPAALLDAFKAMYERYDAENGHVADCESELL